MSFEWAGATIQGISDSVMSWRDLSNSAWMMNEQEGQAQHMAEQSHGWSNHAIQRRVQDLKRAGLNPMLAYMNSGQGASTTGPTPTSGHAAPAMGRGNAAAAMAHSAQAALVRGQVGLLEAQKRNIDADTALKTSSAAHAAAQTDVQKAMVGQIAAIIKDLNAGSDLKAAEEAVKRLDLAKLKATKDAWILLQKNDAYRSEMGLTKLENMNAAERTWWGRLRQLFPSFFFP